MAIKQLKPQLVSPELLERFQRERQALSDLNHPNIVKMLTAMEKSGRHAWCAKLLGFCAESAIASWKDNSFVTYDVIRQAKAALGEEGYQAAFTRGKNLILENFVQGLLAEFRKVD